MSSIGVRLTSKVGTKMSWRRGDDCVCICICTSMGTKMALRGRRRVVIIWKPLEWSNWRGQCNMTAIDISVFILSWWMFSEKPNIFHIFRYVLNSISACMLCSSILLSDDCRWKGKTDGWWSKWSEYDDGWPTVWKLGWSKVRLPNSLKVGCLAGQGSRLSFFALTMFGEAGEDAWKQNNEE